MRFVKVIYFDEGTAADYMQITSGGELKKTTELISDVAGDAGASVEVEATLGTKRKDGIPSLFKALVGIGVDASAEGHVSVDGKKERIAKTILENTLLADFVELIDSDSKKKKEENKKHSAIKQFEKVLLYPQVNSFSYMMLMAPFFTMLEGNVPIDGANGEKFTIDVSKIEDAISRGRGYYEFLGTVNGKESIFRFSSTAFRNNYTMSDIPKMQLSLYAVLVGSAEKKKLDLTSEFQFGAVSKNRIEYQPETSKPSEADHIEVFDVIIAGIAE